MDVYMLVLRLIHVLSGVFWAGSAIFFAILLIPAVGDAGEAGGRVMGALAERKLPRVLGAASGLTVLSGLLMYWRDSNGFSNGFMSSGPGIMFTTGALAALATLVTGGAIVGRATTRLAELGKAVAASGGKPTPEQGAEMGALSARVAKFGKINAVLLVIAVICMGTAQYVIF
jgi:uncharacterized membrane protein